MLTLRSWTDSLPVDTDGASPSGLVGGQPVATKDGAPAPAPAAADGRSRPSGRDGKGKGRR